MHTAMAAHAGLDWVAQNAVKPAVVSLSLGVPAGQWSQPMEDAIKHLTDVVGLPVVVASGNSAKDSCGVAPARVASAITVAASNIPSKFGQTHAGEPLHWSPLQDRGRGRLGSALVYCCVEICSCSAAQ